MHKSSPNQSQNGGMGLVEVMLAMALMTVLALGIASVMRNANQARRHFAQGVDWDQAKQNIMAILNNENACKKTLN